MTSSQSAYMQFMHDKRTDVWIAEATGIPRSTLGFVRREERTLPAQYTDALRTLYQSEAASFLSSRGYPETESIRLSSGMPDTIVGLTGQLDGYIEKIADLHTAKAESLALETGTAFNARDYRQDVIDRIRDNIAYSDLTYEELLDRFPDYISTEGA